MCISMKLEDYIDLEIVYYALCFIIFYEYIFRADKIYIYM